MAQHLKEDVRERIASGALRVFAEKGYRAATMAEIARDAGISTGNVYRYHADKDVLFRAVVSGEFARRFAGLLRRRVKALHGVADVGTLEPDAPYHLLSEELLRFCIENRLRVVVLLGKAQGTDHERFAEKMVQELAKLATAHATSTNPAFDATETTAFALDLIYRNFVTAMVGILARFDGEADIRASVASLSRYHLAGLKSLFERGSSSAASSVRR